MFLYMFKNMDKIVTLLCNHVQLVVVSMIISMLIASFFTVLAILYKRFGNVLIATLSILYTIPSVSLLALLIPITGLGTKTAIIALVFYNLYLLLSNFVSGLQNVEASVIESARAMGMNQLQILYHIQIPLSKVHLLTGIRLATVSTIQIATLAAIINAGGLGTLLFDGLRTMNTDKILSGSLLSACLAIFANTCLLRISKHWEVG